MKNTKAKSKKPAALIILLAIIIAIAAYFVHDYVGSPGKEVMINIESGMSTGDIYTALKKNGVIDSKRLFAFFARNDAKDFKAGNHTLHKNMGYKAACEELKRIVAAEDDISVTIPEGYNIREMAELMEEKGIKSADDFIKAANGKYDYDFLPPVKDGYLEGYLFPETYTLSPKMETREIVDMMLREFDSVFTDEDKARAEELGMTTHEIITLASIIEKEAAVPDERELVSSVFHNRLHSDEYPYLQSCATVQYVLPEIKEVLSDEDIKIDSPYNTYKYKGLPPGPIASPGRACIEAALYPAKTNYYFFVSNGDGTQTFSETYDEHLQSGINR
ncbi:MAG: endolytic transglycosylase MltG [Clostridia bacterium]|nr:endolytic transglycosylase MltG [Clostridia bacterium]